MKKLHVLILAVCLHAPSLAKNLPFVELTWKGTATPFYANASDDTQQAVLDVMRNAQMAERMATLAQNAFRLRQDISVGFESCGKANAFFSPYRQSIVICTEFVELIGQLLKSDRGIANFTPEQKVLWFKGVVWGVYLHELAHAIIHINGVSITGREEDVADQFAIWYAVYFVDLQRQPIITPTVWFYREISKRRNLAGMSGESLEQVLANEHSLDEVRIYNIACWGLGANPTMGAKTAQLVGLPESRAVRCPGEFVSLDKGMREQFKRYLRPRPPR
jgi:hypothetical protein